MQVREFSELAHQGDIFILRVDGLPKDAEKITKPLNGADREAYGYHPSKGLVLAQGESRQHYHAFRNTDEVEMYRVPANDNTGMDRLYIVLKSDQVLEHEEHDGHLRTAGVDLFGFQYEETFESEYRRVAD